MELKTARKIARLTQSGLAMQVGVDPSTISLIETEKRNYLSCRYGDIVRIARAVNLDPEELFPVAPIETATEADRRSGEERRAS